VRNKFVLLKPNLVDYIQRIRVDPNPILLGAAAECVRRLGAAGIVVGDGPGHERDDIERLLVESGLGSVLKDTGAEFIDLNREDVVGTPLRAQYTGLESLWLPKTALGANHVVSMPKVKTDHWSGVTLSMKNMVVPSVKNSWPKNLLHWRAIQPSMVDLAANVPVHFVIADARVCTEGSGPLAGTSRRLSRMVSGDATRAMLMGPCPKRIPPVSETAKFPGHISALRIEQLACPVLPPRVPFAPMPEFEHLRGVSDRRMSA